jgi:hypothetical protein
MGRIRLPKKLFASGIILFVLLIFSFVISIGVSSVIWSKSYRKAGDQGVASMVETSDGGFALAGSTNSSGSTVYSTDFWLVKTDEFGNMQWNQTYGYEEFDEFQSLVETSDGGYALAGFTGSETYFDFWLVKTDINGNLMWNKTYGQIYRDYCYSVVETSDGGFALAGYTLSLVGNLEDYLLIKTDSSGNMLWNKTYGGEKRDYAYSLVETADGGFALGGYSGHLDSKFLLVKTDAFGNMEWNKTYGGEGKDRAYSLIETSDEGFVLAGRTTSFGVDSIVFYLVKTDVNGNLQWNKTYGEPSYGWGGYSVIETSDGEYAFTGVATYSNQDGWLIKTDVNGNVVWNQTYMLNGQQTTSSLVETSDGGYALGGYTESVDGDSDFWLVRTDEQGIPEFPSWTILPLLLAATLAAIIYRKKLHRKPN